MHKDNTDSSFLSSIISLFRPSLLQWAFLVDYSSLKHDLSAGVTVFILLIPQGLAYSLLAGTPPVYGLYTAAMPLIAYAIFGTSRQLAIGPMAIASLLSASAVGSLKSDDGELLEEESDEWVEASVTLAFLTGVVMMGLAVMGVGDHISRCLSGSVLSGFTTGAACIIFLSQVSKLLGMSLERKAYSHQSIAAICTHFDDLSVAALLIGVVTALSLFAVKHWRMQQKKLREEQAGREAQEASSSGSGSVLMTMVRALSRFSLLLACISTTVLSWALHNYSSVTLPVIGSVPRGLKSPAVPTLTSSLVLDLLPGAFIFAMVTFAGNWAVAKKFSISFNYSVNPNNELVAYSISNIVSSLFHGIAVAGGLARSAVNSEAGAETQLAGVISGVCMIFALQFFTTLFYYMPIATLAAVIMVSVLSMMDFARMRSAYSCGFHVDFVVLVGTALCTFFAGVTVGLLSGVALSIAGLLISTSSSDFSTTNKSAIEKKRVLKAPQAVSCLDSASAGKVVIFRMSSILYFGNLDRFKSSLKSTCRALVASVLHDYHCSGRPDSCSSSSSKPVVHAAIVLDAKSWGHYIELPTALALEELREDFLTAAPGSSSAATVVRVHLGIVNCHPYVLERLEAYGLSKKMGEELMFEDEGECWSRCGGALEKLNMSRVEEKVLSSKMDMNENFDDTFSNDRSTRGSRVKMYELSTDEPLNPDDL